MIYLKWVNEGWRFDAGIVTARFDDGTVVEIPIGKARFGAFYVTRVGEHEWRIAPVRFPKSRPESLLSVKNVETWRTKPIRKHR